MEARGREARVGDLIRRIDEAVSLRDDVSCCRGVKAALGETLRGQDGLFDPDLLRTSADGYARRLLHRDPAGRFTLVVMVWDAGQGTELHDHAGIWCVECVHSGRIEVTSFSVRGGDADSGVVQFGEESRVLAGVGEAGALIPPFEYHTIHNPFDDPAVTLHVYGGEMTHCHVYLPLAGGGYQRRWRELTYTD